ncbi:hypothetical protein NW768_011454 [Fusarium equiseti]|uniref:Uncharacterized protein n=1 Tax=Fusarium equiseti TaxID=61235 RepID=A0ABQ8QY12_FUSEQ|nr:hypothetical protein NW768_011454 [Fusarium equiseti]
MPSAFGFVKSVAGGNKFTSAFVIDDIIYHFSGNLSPALQDFHSNEAILEYNSIAELTSQQDFDGKIGTSDIQLNASNGATIRGPLEMPISPASRVSGSGVWFQN